MSRSRPVRERSRRRAWRLSTRRARWLIVLAVVGLAVVTVPRFLVSTRFDDPRLESPQRSDTLVVVMHGMSGTASLNGITNVVRRAYPDADLVAPTFPAHPLSNVDPYLLADAVETYIASADRQRPYTRVVLVGHSMGAVLLRKVLVWAHGFEEDRPQPRGERAWARKVDRFVSLAGINRGWSIDPAPDRMQWPRYLSIYLGERFGRLTGTGTLVRSLQRGAPFIADLRVQWIHAARRPARSVAGKLPLVVHVIGSIDDIVSADDSRDVAAAKDVKFMTVPNVGHGEIAEALRAGGPVDTLLDERIHAALTAPPDQLVADLDSPLTENLKVTRVVYIMHGIRDHASWSDHIRTALKAALPADVRDSVAIVPAKYGYFPMLPFLLSQDRQRNVRWFMDEFTDNLAKFPLATEFDYVGHSNGTYILASALQRYRTLKMRNVVFAGSVVPKHYPWRALVDGRRVAEVTNVVATSDWVVALFPRLFEQIAEWAHRQPVRGVLDIGSAGFRGFNASQLAEGRIENLRYVAGGHGAGVDVSVERRLQAIVQYLATGDRSNLNALRDADTQPTWLDWLSNVSWVVWLALAGVIVAIGRLLHRLGGAHTVRIGNRTVGRATLLVLAYLALLLALLYSI